MTLVLMVFIEYYVKTVALLMLKDCTITQVTAISIDVICKSKGTASGTILVIAEAAKRQSRTKEKVKVVHTVAFRTYGNTRKKDVVRCLDVLSAKKNRRPMHIAFVGDSTVRQHFFSFIQVKFVDKNVIYYLSQFSIHFLLLFVFHIVDS